LRLAIIFSALFTVQYPSFLNAATTSIHQENSRLYKTITSYLDFKKNNVVMQQYDYSCGAAALATLMKFYYNDNVSEKSLLNLAKTSTSINQESIKIKGLSLLDLKHIAIQKGYRAAGFKLTVNQLRLLTGPVLIFYKPRDFPHFAVFKKISKSRVYIADPARGNVRVSINNFLAIWDGHVLALEK